ncbi:MAG: hypothetical protein R3F35_17155 [Myxococcota bacterium]
MVHRIVRAARVAVVVAAALAASAVAAALPPTDIAPSADIVPVGPGEPLEADAASATAVASAAVVDAEALFDPEAMAETASSTSPDRVASAWRAAPPTPHARTAALRRLRLEYGLGDLPAPAQVVLAAADPDDPETGTMLARELAPQMPALGWVHVRDLWRAGAFGEAVRAFGGVVTAATRDLESQLWLAGNAVILAWLVVLATAGGFILLLAAKAFPRAAHDLADPLSTATPGFARAVLLVAALMLPLALGEGVAGFVLAAFVVAFVYADPLERSALVLSAIAWTVALHPLAHWASVAATGLELDPIARSALAVSRGTPTRADLERLEAHFDDDLAAAHAIAYHARRAGDEAVATARLEALAALHPADPVALANLGNVEMRAGRTEEAIALYERAASQTASPALLFDLSQAYSNVLRMDEAELALVRAQHLADAEVAALSSLSDPRLVADLGFPVSTLRARLETLSVDRTPTLRLVQILAPGRMGRNVRTAGAAFGIAVLFGMLAPSRFDRSSVCHRCGHRICTRCDETVWSDDLCEDCHHLFKNPDATDAKLRTARLQVLARREAWRSRLVAAGAVLVPGVAGLAVRRPDVALLSLALLAWGIAWLRWPAGVLVDTTWLGGLAPVVLGVFGVLALAGYAAIVAASLFVRRTR